MLPVGLATGTLSNNNMLRTARYSHGGQSCVAADGGCWVQSLKEKIPNEARRRERAVAELQAMLRKSLPQWVSGNSLERCVAWF